MSEANGVNRAGLYFGMAGTALLFIGALGSVFYIGFVAKANTDVIAAQERLIAALSGRIGVVEDRTTKIEVAANEIETQFCAADTTRNLIHASDLRNYAILYKQVFGAEFPIGNAFYPTICNRKSK
jgi:hypothetical protein